MFYKNIKIILLFIFVILLIDCHADYYRGTIEQYQADHLNYQIEQDWTQDEIDNGKISTDFWKNPKENVTRTMKIFDVICQNPDESNDYLWKKYTDNQTIQILTDNEFNILYKEWYSNFM